MMMEEEEVPIANFKDMSRNDWRVVHRLDPYRFPERTCEGDNRFWTHTQFKIWNGFYLALAEKVVKPKICDEEYFVEHKDNGLKHIYTALENMNILKLAMVYQSYCPDLISQFYCTVFFHNDSVRTMTWMFGESKYTSTLSTFALALGYVWEDVTSDHGFKVYDQLNNPRICSLIVIL